MGTACGGKSEPLFRFCTDNRSFCDTGGTGTDELYELFCERNPARTDLETADMDFYTDCVS